MKSNGPKAVIFQAHGASFGQILGGGKWPRFPSLGCLQAAQKHWFCLRLLCEHPILSPKNEPVLGGEKRHHFLLIFLELRQVFCNILAPEFGLSFWLKRFIIVEFSAIRIISERLVNPGSLCNVKIWLKYRYMQQAAPVLAYSFWSPQSGHHFERHCVSAVLETFGGRLAQFCKPWAIPARAILKIMGVLWYGEPL